MHLLRHRFMLPCVLIMISMMPVLMLGDEVYSPGNIIRSSHQNQAVEPEPYAEPFSRIITVDYQKQSLEKVLDDLTKQLDCPVYVDWVSLLNVGVEKELPITLQLQNTPLQKVLERVLAIASEQNDLDPIWYDVQQNVIRISKKRHIFNSNQQIIVYDVHDLIGDDPIVSEPPKFNDDHQMFDEDGTFRPGNERMHHIIDLIRTHVEPREQWLSNGGDAASITYFNKKLIIFAHSTVHPTISKLLADLRQQAKKKLTIKPPAPKYLIKELSQPVTLDLNQARLEDALAFISNAIHVPIHVDWASLKEVGIEPDLPITISIKQTTAGNALDRILEYPTLAEGFDPIWHDESAEAISVSTQIKLLMQNQYTQIYDVRDLLPQIDTEKSDQNAMERYEYLVDELQAQVRTINNLSWKEYGGTISSLSHVNGKFIIKTHPVIHEQILNLLQSLLN